MEAQKKINNVDLSYPIFDVVEDHANVPLKLINSRISTTDSRKPLKSDSPCPDSEDGENSQEQADGILKNGSEFRSSAYGGEESDGGAESDESTSIKVP